jgi:DNA repair photolyase
MQKLRPVTLISVRAPSEHVFVRWDNLKTERDQSAEQRLPGFDFGPKTRTFDAPEGVGVRFHEIEARSAINRIPSGGRFGFDYTINPYRGCTHACRYCFARPTHEYLDMNAWEDFEREIVVKVNLPEVLRAELRRPSWKGDLIALGTNTDPYQWVEGRYRLTRAIWEELLAARNPCSILTKSPLVLRDLDLLTKLNERTRFSAALSIPTIDEKAWRATEPGTPNPRKRIEAVAELSAAGVRTSVLIAPLMPGINDAPGQIAEILELCGEAGASGISGVPLHLKGPLKDLFIDWLRQYRPDLVPQYERLYSRGAYLPAAERKRITQPLRRAQQASVGYRRG